MLDASEIDRISHLTQLPLMRLVDWKNRTADPFELRCSPGPDGTLNVQLNTPQPTSVPGVVVLVHGDYESRKEDDGSIVYKALPGNSMGQVAAPDGKPAFGVGYDMTELDAQGRPVLKVYFGSATEWFVKNAYHGKWNDLREVKRELEPDSTPAPQPDAPRSKESGRNPRDRKRAEEQQAGGGRHRGRRGGRGRR